MSTFLAAESGVDATPASMAILQIPAEIGRKTEKTEIWSWKRPESNELSNDILGRAYRGQLLVQKICDGSRTDVDDTTAEMIAKTRYTNFNR